MNLLERHLSQFSSAPFLFVGSGMPRRYLDLPTWGELLKKFCEGLPKPYEYYFSSADGNLQRTAHLIASDFHHHWWQADEYAVSRADLASEEMFTSSALKIEISRFFRGVNVDGATGRLSRELRMLKDCKIDGVITTNWDLLLEHTFPDYSVYVGQNELLFSSTQGIGEIYKIHGSCTDPNSLVLTESDYAEFNRRNPYLSAKLLAIFVEHPTIFLGYCLTDPNIRETLRVIASSLTQTNIKRLEDRLIVVTWDQSADRPTLTTSQIIVDEYIIPVHVLTTRSFEPIYSALSRFKRKFPVKVLRQLKEHVYSLVLENDPKGQLFVQDIEPNSDLTLADVVLGVGARALITDQGYSKLDRHDLVFDALSDDHKLCAEKVVMKLLPDLLGSTKYVPMCKYLSGAGFDMAAVGEYSPDLPHRVVVAFNHNRNVWHLRTNLSWARKALKAQCSSAKDLLAIASNDDFVSILPYLPIHPGENDQVRLRLGEALLSMGDSQHKFPTGLGKAVCYYDLVTYFPSAVRLTKDP